LRGRRDKEKKREWEKKLKGNRGRECFLGCPDRKDIEEVKALWDAQTERT
jgi:hypothetical protein